MYKVVLVDDEPIIVEGLSRSVEWEKWNCKVVATAHDGLEGRKIIEEVNPDIVFMDICMPEMNGLEALIAIRKADPGAKVIMVSALGQESMVRDAVMAGAKGFVVKPFKEETITAALAKL